MSNHVTQKIAADMIPETVPGWQGLRAIAEEAIQRYVTEDYSADSRKRIVRPAFDRNLRRINSAADLEAFRAQHGLRTDWHEPDNNGIDAQVIGHTLDNAMGPTVEHGFGELNVVLLEEAQDGEGGTFDPIAVVNLATLLGWATDGAQSHAALIST